MNQSSDSWDTRLDELVTAMRDDILSDEQSVELQNLLQTQPGARRRFAESMHLSAMLSDGVQAHEPKTASLKSTSDTAAGTRRFRSNSDNLVGNFRYDSFRIAVGETSRRPERIAR